ncbi:MAG: hypothetical protein ACOVP5_03410, partial [Chitinophagales bacterium]
MKFHYLLLVSISLLFSCDETSTKSKESAIDQTVPVAAPPTIPDQMAKMNSNLPEIFGKNHLGQQVDIRKIPAKLILL